MHDETNQNCWLGDAMSVLNFLNENNVERKPTDCPCGGKGICGVKIYVPDSPDADAVLPVAGSMVIIHFQARVRLNGREVNLAREMIKTGLGIEVPLSKIFAEHKIGAVEMALRYGIDDSDDTYLN